MTLGQRVGLAIARAHADGHGVHHVTLTEDAFRQVGLPGSAYVWGPRAKNCVVWAKSADHRMIPYVVEG